MPSKPTPAKPTSDSMTSLAPPSRIRTIVVPLDGSELSEGALPMALSLARASGATVHLVRVLVPPPLDTHVPGFFDTARNLDQAVEAEARAYLEELKRRHGGAGAPQLEGELLGAHSPDDSLGDTRAVVAALGELVLRRKPDLIVMTSHGLGGVSRAWLGSVADGVMRRSGVPVLLVRPGTPGSTPLLEHILVPLDGSGLAEQVLPTARALAALGKAKLTLLRVLVPLHAIAKPAPVARVDKADLSLKQADAEDYFRRVRAAVDVAQALDTQIVVDKNPARAIIEYAEKNGVDLIAMTTQGLGGVKRLLIGSVADKVVRGTAGNVLVYRGTT